MMDVPEPFIAVGEDRLWGMQRHKERQLFTLMRRIAAGRKVLNLKRSEVLVGLVQAVNPLR
jgi:hypothetical protein